MFREPLLAHPSERGGVHTTWHPHSGDKDDRDRHDDEADDEQHRFRRNRAFLGVRRSLQFHRPLSVRLCTGLKCVNAVAVREKPGAISACGGHGRNAWPLCAFGNSAVQPRRVLMWHGGTAMTDQGVTVGGREAQILWRNWQARGAEGDRRTATRMRGLMILIAAVFVMWFVVQLA